MEQQELAVIRARLEAATQGTWWSAEKQDEYAACPLCDGDGYVGQETIEQDQWPVMVQCFGIGDVVGAHARFVKHAPADLRTLLDEVERLRNTISRLQSEHAEDVAGLRKVSERMAHIIQAVCCPRECSTKRFSEACDLCAYATVLKEARAMGLGVR